jgi:hypothetical protein
MTTAAPPAWPRDPGEIRALPSCPEILGLAHVRGITDVVHFTTSRGALGVLSRRAVLSRKRLPEDAYLAHVYRPNALNRKDPAWLDYVSLSISQINDWMFETSQRWHVAEGMSWVVLSFTPEILTHAGVVFTTTNNIYPARLRAEGRAGFEQMFASRVASRYGGIKIRPPGYPASCPTDRQAEVLYPGEVSLTYLQRIDVQTGPCHDDIEGMLGALNLDVQVRLAPHVFG